MAAAATGNNGNGPLLGRRQVSLQNHIGMFKQCQPVGAVHHTFQHFAHNILRIIDQFLGHDISPACYGFPVVIVLVTNLIRKWQMTSGDMDSVLYEGDFSLFLR